MVCLSRQYHLKFFKGCLPQNLIGPFFNSLHNFDFNYKILKHSKLLCSFHIVEDSAVNILSSWLVRQKYVFLLSNIIWCQAPICNDRR